MVADGARTVAVRAWDKAGNGPDTASGDANPVAVTFIVAIYSIRHAVYAAVGLTYDHAPWPTVFVYESVKLLLFSALWLAIIFGLESFGRWRLDGKDQDLTASELESYSSLVRLELTAGKPPADNGHGLMVQDDTAESHHWKVGDTVAM